MQALPASWHDQWNSWEEQNQFAGRRGWGGLGAPARRGQCLQLSLRRHRPPRKEQTPSSWCWLGEQLRVLGRRPHGHGKGLRLGEGWGGGGAERTQGQTATAAGHGQRRSPSRPHARGPASATAALSHCRARGQLTAPRTSPGRPRLANARSSTRLDQGSTSLRGAACQSPPRPPPAGHWCIAYTTTLQQQACCFPGQGCLPVAIAGAERSRLAVESAAAVLRPARPTRCRKATSSAATHHQRCAPCRPPCPCGPALVGCASLAILIQLAYLKIRGVSTMTQSCGGGIVLDHAEPDGACVAMPG